jgi:hypothetical protein
MAEQNRERAALRRLRRGQRLHPRKPTVYERILVAFDAGRGMRLSAVEVGKLGRDEAIRSRAEQDRLGSDE